MSRDRDVQKLAEKGYEHLQRQEYDEALVTSSQLRSLRHSSGFEIAAMALAGKGDLDGAIDTLREGVAAAPDCWINWQLYGNLLSDTERYEEAGLAYESALRCPHVRPASVRLNQAILSRRVGRLDQALGYLKDVDEPQLSGWRAVERAEICMQLDRHEEARDEVSKVLCDDDTDASLAARAATAYALLQMQAGEKPDRVRAYAVEMLRRTGPHPSLLHLIRELDACYSANAGYYRLTLHASEQSQRYYVSCDVVAESPQEAVTWVQRLDPEPLNYTIEEEELLEKRPDEPLGVYWQSGRVYYEEDG